MSDYVKRSPRGFTLIELLVVISIILIASSIIIVGTGGGDGMKLSSAQRIVSGIAQGARGQAILKNAPTRLIIYSENNPNGDPEKFLRYFGIVYYMEDDPATSATDPGWLAATQGDMLPEGIYFDPDLSSDNDWPTSATMDLDYPRRTVGANSDRDDGGGSEEYYYYEFNSNGTMEQAFNNAWLVFRAGELRPGAGGDLEVLFDSPEKELLRSALIFRRVGTTTPVDDPEAIQED